MVTEFEKKVYELVSLIPKGKVTTYKIIADKLNSSPRAVGNALSKNPFAPTVPCHRVIKSNGKIGGFNGSVNNSDKHRILKSEGILISNDMITNHSIIYNFD